MHTIVIAITLSNMNNFKHLPEQFTLGSGKGTRRIITHSDPRVSIVEDDTLANFDLLINESFSAEVHRTTRWDEILPSNQIVTLPRPGKAVQAIQMHRAAKAAKLRNYRHVPTWDNFSSPTDSCNPWTFASGYKGQVVIKTMNGARGVGQVQFDSNVVPVDFVLQCIDQGSKGLEKLKERHPSVAIPTERAHNDREVPSLLQSDLFLQEVVENVDAEYRMLLRPDGEHWIYRRDRKPQDGFLQATGEFDEYTPENDYTYLSNHPQLKQHCGEIYELFLALGMSYGAVDLFTTNGGSWGVFEYSNQFGTVGYKLSDMTQYHIDFIASILP